MDILTAKISANMAKNELAESGQIGYAEDNAPIIDAVTFPAGENAVEGQLLGLVVGETYVMRVNGTEYTYTAQEVDGWILVGVLDDGPCMIVDVPADNLYAVGLVEPATVSLYPAETIRPIDGKYLPIGTPWIEAGGIVEALPETTLTVDSGVTTYPDLIDISAGEICTISYNGVEYECEAQTTTVDGIECVGLGDFGVFAGAEATGEYPFGAVILPSSVAAELGFGGGIVPLDAAASITISIKKLGDVPHVIDKRCLGELGIPANIKDATAIGAVRTISSREESDDYSLGRYAFAEGNNTTASGECSHAEGYHTTASGYSSHAEGNNTTASTVYSHAEGYHTTASGSSSHAEGRNTTASGDYSHAEGCNTTASGDYSHAEGSYTTASGYNSHAEGTYTTASGGYSHAEGRTTTASGLHSHAEGSYTTASGDNSHTEGAYTTASGDYSHAEGSYTTASGEYQHVQGKYNIEDTANTYAHIVGNGTSTSARSNAHTLDWDGNAWFAGTVEGTALILTSPNGTRFSVAVADDGTLTATAVS